MNTKEKMKIADMVKRSMPREHNWKLIERAVMQTIAIMEKRPWWKRVLKK